MSPLYFLAAVPIFALMVLVHEFGHFIVAKRAGIRVEEFGIGFPPRLFGIRRGETLYSINALPIGGFVRMPGENGETTDANGAVDPRSFAVKSARARAAVLLAGVAMNLLLAIVLFSTAEAVGTVEYRPAIAKVVAGSAAEKAGVLPGDTILAVDGQPIKYFSDLRRLVGQDISNAPTDAKTVPVVLTIKHADAQTPETLTVQAPVQLQAPLGVEAQQSDPYHLRPPIWKAPLLGIQDIGTVAVGTAQGIGMIVHGLIPWNQAVQGPVGIVNITAQTASAVPEVGWYPILFLAGFLSLNLAFFNLLPIPGLDGGRLLFVVIEIVRRGKRVSPQREALVHLIGMATLIFLVLLVTINDVSGFGGGH